MGKPVARLARPLVSPHLADRYWRRHRLAGPVRVGMPRISSDQVSARLPRITLLSQPEAEERVAWRAR